MGDISIKGRSPILRQGFATGGVAKLGKELAKKFKKKKVYPETEDLTHQVGPYVGDVGSEGKRRGLGPRGGKGKSPGRPKAGPKQPQPLPRWKKQPKWLPPKRKFPPEKPKWKNMPRNPNEKPKWQAMKKGGKADKKLIQKATASIKRRKTKGKCTPITKKGCTGRAKALAKTFKKMAKKRKAA